MVFMSRVMCIGNLLLLHLIINKDEVKKLLLFYGCIYFKLVVISNNIFNKNNNFENLTRNNFQ